MCDEAVDDCLAALKFIPYWFVTSKILEKFHHALLANPNILNEVFNKVIVFANQMGILAVDLDKLILMMIIIILIKMILILIFMSDLSDIQ